MRRSPISTGNFATNITAGSRFGYLLIWVLVASNLMAMLIQYLSAKAGLATGKSLPELCRDQFPKPVTRGLWLQAELVAIATDLAEVLGGAIALRLLFDLPLLTGGVITAVVAFGLLGCRPGVLDRSRSPSPACCSRLVGFFTAWWSAASMSKPRPPSGTSIRGHRDRAAGDRDAGGDRDAARHLLHGALTQNRYVRSTEQERWRCCAVSGWTWCPRWRSPG